MAGENSLVVLRQQAFLPVVDEQATTLILGSMPRVC